MNITIMREKKPSIKIDQLKSMMLQYLQEAANEKDDSDIEADTDKWARKILEYDFKRNSTEGIKGNLEEIPSNVDLEKDVESWFFNEISHKINIEHTMYHYFQECARRYFELGLNARKEE